MTCRQHILALLLVCLSPFAAGAVERAPPSAVVAEYRVTKAGVHVGTVKETFSREGERYRIVSETRTAGPLRLFLKDRLVISAEGRIGPAGLEPERYEYRRDRDAAKNLVATFDRMHSRIVSRFADRTENFDLPTGGMDRASAMYQFMFRAPSSETVNTWMSQGKKAEHYRYRLQGEATLHLAGRALRTVQFVRDAAEGESRAKMWLAADLHYLPVKMEFEDSGGLALEQTLVALSVQ
jgi:Protein of unknown function (DUF3108)